MDLSHFARRTHRRLVASQFYPLALGSFLAIAMLGVRVAVTGRLTFVFLAWNLFLAWIPYVFTPVRAPRPLAWTSTALWLLFLPNAPYLVTDLVHLRARAEIAFAFDLALLALFAVLGVALMIASLARVHAAVERASDRRRGWWFVTVVIVLSSLGVYLGRVLRWNSWDAIVAPHSLLAHLCSLPDPPAVATQALAFVLIGSASLLALYASARERLVRH